MPPQIMEANQPRAFELAWNGIESHEIENKDAEKPADGAKEEMVRLKPLEPIIFLLQVRTFFGPEFDPMNANKWKTLAMVSTSLMATHPAY